MKIEHILSSIANSGINSINLDEASKEAMETDYAVFSVGEEVNTADAAAFFLEGYQLAVKKITEHLAQIEEQQNLIKTADLLYYARQVEKATGITVDQMKIKTRKREIVQARQLAMWAMKKYTKHSLFLIGSFFDKDHATVLHAVKTVKNLSETNKEYRGIRKEIIDLIESHSTEEDEQEEPENENLNT